MSFKCGGSFSFFYFSYTSSAQSTSVPTRVALLVSLLTWSSSKDKGGTGGWDCVCQAPRTLQLWGNVREVHWLIICLPRPLPWEPACFHAPSPPDLRFLCLIVWWPIPWPPDPEKDRWRACKRHKGVAESGPSNPGMLRRHLHHLAGVDRDGFGHQPLQVAAQTDTFHADEGLLGQHCPERAQMSRDNHSLYQSNVKILKWECDHED